MELRATVKIASVLKSLIAAACPKMDAHADKDAAAVSENAAASKQLH